MSLSTVLLTGATGFIGGAAAAELLIRHPSYRVLALVRGESREIAERRVQQSLLRFLSPSILEATSSRLDVIRGDLIDPITLTDSRLSEVTHVLHLAANTSMRSVRAVRHTNILGALALAHRMRKVPSLKRFLYVGTAFICGANPPRIVFEDDFPRLDVHHLVEYTASKAECEMLLERTAQELPLVIARPTIVVGHTGLGCLPSSSIFWYYRVLNLLRRVPAPVEKLKDIIPVDYTAKALLHLLFKPKLSYQRYHISAGTAASVSWRDIDTAFANVGSRQERKACRVVDFTTLLKERDRLRDILGPGDESTLLAMMEQFFKFGASGVEVFDNNRILEEGMPPPPRFTSYLPLCAVQSANRSVYQQMLDEIG